MDLPLGLRTAIEGGRCVLFVGAGVGHNATDARGRPAPTGIELATELADKFGIVLDGPPDLPKIAQIVELRKGRAELNAFLSERLHSLEPDPALTWLFSLTWSAIFTTNYDRLIQRSYELLPNPTQRPVTFTASSEITYCDPRFDVPVYHLHGSLFEGTTPFALITEEDYARFREHRRMLFEILKTHYATTPFLYVGYSNQDPNWKTVLAELTDEFVPAKPPTSYRVDPFTPILDREILTARDIVTLEADLTTFSREVLLTVGDIHVEPRSLEQLEKDIPQDLKAHFEANPAGVLRLLGSWTYLPQERFDAIANTADFLDGNHPNWSLIASENHFRRDIEAPVLDDLLTYATDLDPGVRALLILAPAGYGISTTLMSLAVTLVKERAGPVFFHRPGTRLTEGDIEFAAQCFPERKFFVVDNAVDEAEGILSAVRKLRDRTDTACFLTGSRLNEWRQAGPRLHPKEYEMSPLSDPEIERLLDCLGQHGALGRLEGLPRSAQEAAIKVRYKQDLLVAMKEATEGQSFNAIIEDEYRGMATDFGQQLYATVCGFYRLRAFARDSLLAHIMKRPYSDLFGHEADCTKGVIFWDDLDVARGIYGARARHHLISEIVWRRCLEGHQRQQIMLDAMSSLNLNYAADAQAFERFVRSDDTLEDIGTLEAKLDFFEMACKKDPRSPYVRQHFARMFRREGRFDLALDQIRHALGIDSDVLVLYHTQGTILADLAVTAASDELGRKWLAQSELSFRHILSRRPRDDYAFQGLADLYLRWAKRISSPDERADYLRRCEGVIAEGLKAVRSKESLWIISADVAGYVGDHPETVAALEKAVNESGSALTRYLLAREHYRAHKYRDALAVLEPLVGSGSEDARNEYRACLLYSQAQWKMRRPPADCIPALRVSELYGLRDAAFIATYAGLLFLSGEYTEADKLWRAARSDSNLSFQETTKVHLYPNVPAPRLEGTVGAVKPGYCFLRVPGLPDIMFPGSRYRGQAMKVGLKVSFEIGFAAGGPTVLDFAIAEASAH